MNVPTLTEKGRLWAAALLGLLILLASSYVYGRAKGAASVKDAADAKMAQATHTATLTLQRSADSIEVISRKYEALAAAQKAPHVAAIARTDSADTIAVHFRHDAEHLANDSTATRTQLAQAIDSMARADSVLDARRVSERNAAMARIMALETALRNDTLTIQAKDLALQASAKDYAALEQVVRDLKGQRIGIIHRLLTGGLTVIAAGACGAAGSLAGPAVAIGAVVACTAAVAVFSP